MGSLKGKKFVASYSGGKDSALAVYRAINEGLLPLSLMTAYNTDTGGSWFHGVPESLLKKVERSLGIPLTFIKTSGGQYTANFEEALAEAVRRGAEVCVFGDIDIEEHLEWCSARCENAGIIPYFPLWGGDRKELVREFIDAGFSAVITVVNTELMREGFRGEILTHEIALAIEKSGTDICGENGEYHTFVFDGPIFKEKVDFSILHALYIV